MPRAFRIALWGLLVIVPFAAVRLPLPWYAIGPGRTVEVAPLIRFDELERFDSGGSLVMTTIGYERVTPAKAVQVWLDDRWHAVTKEQLFGPDVSPEEEEAISTAQMTQSQLHATSVVLSALTSYPQEHAPGALVDVTIPGCPADGVLFAGEVVTSIDGEPVDSSDEAGDLIRAAEPGQPMSFDVRSGDARREVDLAKTRCVDSVQRALVGVNLIEPFPVDVEIDSAEVGGPSGGLVFALALYDLLTPGDLTGGRTIAGTGTLGLDGGVGGIGGIRDKVYGAEAVGASLFLVPRENLNELQGVDTGAMRVVAVDTFDEAVDVLLEAGGEVDGDAVPTAA
jgi:PDZ domain-containing protein